MLPNARETARRAPAEADERYTFREVGESDLLLLTDWLRQEHVERWWPKSEEQLQEIRGILTSVSVDAYIVGLEGKPFAYIQTYDIRSAWGLGVYLDQPVGTVGIDQFIGEASMVGRGHGPRFIEAMCKRLFAAGAPRVIVDPDPANGRAIRAYEKAGFRMLDERTIDAGPVVLMARDRAN
jgi:aminoglycoside 6'-N-acetyltransferase